MTTLWLDIKLSIRSLSKVPGFTAIVLLCLALGIGANTAIYSIILGVVIDPMPFKNGNDIVQIDTVGTSGNLVDIPFTVTPVNYEIFSAEQNMFDELGVAQFSTYALNLDSGTEALTGAAFSPEILRVFRINPLLGRFFVDDDFDRSVVVLSEGAWRTKFGEDPDIIGRTIQLDTTTREIIGVVPQELRFPAGSDIWVPLNDSTLDDNARKSGRYLAYGRLKAGITLQQAREQLKAINRIAKETYPNVNNNFELALTPIKERLFFLPTGGSLDQSVLVLLLAVSLLFAIACVNITNLLLARIEKQTRTYALRIAIGSNRGRILRLLVTEALLLGLFGGAIGVAIAFVSMPLIVAAAPPILPGFKPLTIDLPVLVTSTAVAVVALVAIALFQFRRVSRTNVVDALKEGSYKGATSSRSATLVQNGLIVAQIALSLTMLVGAGLMIKSFSLIQEIDPGFDPDNVYTLQVNVPDSWGDDWTQHTAFYDQVIERVSAIPGVMSAGTSLALPIGDRRVYSRFNFMDIPPTPEQPYQIAIVEAVAPGYLETMRVPLIRGRLINESDTVNSQPVILISQSMADRYFPGEDPIGKEFQSIVDERNSITRVVVGVVGDISNEGNQTVRQLGGLTFYDALTQMTGGLRVNQSRLAVRTQGDPNQYIQAIHAAVWSVDRLAMVSNTATMNQRLEAAVQNSAFNTILLSLMAGLGMTLALIGIYGVMSYVVNQRTQELGLRIVLGASTGKIIGMVIGRASKLAVSGFIVGLIIIGALSQYLSSLLYQVSPIDLPVYLGIIASLYAAVILAAFLPAFRASNIDPAMALREE